MRARDTIKGLNRILRRRAWTSGRGWPLGDSVGVTAFAELIATRQTVAPMDLAPAARHSRRNGASGRKAALSRDEGEPGVIASAFASGFSWDRL